MYVSSEQAMCEGQEVHLCQSTVGSPLLKTRASGFLKVLIPSVRLFDMAACDEQLRGVSFAYDGMHTAFTHANIGTIVIRVKQLPRLPPMELMLNGPVKELSLDEIQHEHIQALDIVLASSMDPRYIWRMGIAGA